MTHDNTFLTDAQREQLRAQLEARKEQLLQELNAAQRDNLSLLPSRGDAAHPDDRKEHSEDMFFNTVRDAEASRAQGRVNEQAGRKAESAAAYAKFLELTAPADGQAKADPERDMIRFKLNQLKK